MCRLSLVRALVIIPTFVAMTLVVPLHVAAEHGAHEAPGHHEGGDHPDSDHQILTDARPIAPLLDLPGIITPADYLVVVLPLASLGFTRPVDQRYHPPNNSYKLSLARAPPPFHV